MFVWAYLDFFIDDVVQIGEIFPERGQLSIVPNVKQHGPGVVEKPDECRLPMDPPGTQLQQRVSVVDGIKLPYCSQEIPSAVQVVPMQTMSQSPTPSNGVPERAVKLAHCGTRGKSLESDGGSNVSDHPVLLTVLFS